MSKLIKSSKTFLQRRAYTLQNEINKKNKGVPLWLQAKKPLIVMHSNSTVLNSMLTILKNCWRIINCFFMGWLKCFYSTPCCFCFFKPFSSSVFFSLIPSCCMLWFVVTTLYHTSKAGRPSPGQMVYKSQWPTLRLAYPPYLCLTQSPSPHLRMPAFRFQNRPRLKPAMMNTLQHDEVEAHLRVAYYVINSIRTDEHGK